MQCFFEEGFGWLFCPNVIRDKEIGEEVADTSHLQARVLHLKDAIRGYIELVVLVEVGEGVEDLGLKDSFFVELLMEELTKGIGIGIDCQRS